MDVMSVRIDPETKRKMAGMADVNWAEVVRESLEDRLQLELELRRPIDRRKATRGARGMDRLRARMSSGEFDSTTEVRRWREHRR